MQNLGESTTVKCPPRAKRLKALPRRAISIIEPYLADPPYHGLVVSAIGQLGAAAKPAVPTLVTAMKNKELFPETDLALTSPGSVTPRAALALGQIGAKNAIPDIIAAAQRWPGPPEPFAQAIVDMGPEGLDVFFEASHRFRMKTEIGPSEAAIYFRTQALYGTTVFPSLIKRLASNERETCLSVSV